MIWSALLRDPSNCYGGKRLGREASKGTCSGLLQDTGKRNGKTRSKVREMEIEKTIENQRLK